MNENPKMPKFSIVLNNLPKFSKARLSNLPKFSVLFHLICTFRIIFNQAKLCVMCLDLLLEQI